MLFFLVEVRPMNYVLRLSHRFPPVYITGGIPISFKVT